MLLLGGWRVRRRLRQGPEAAAALGPKAAPALCRLLAHPRHREGAAKALVKLGASARPVLLKELEAGRLPARRIVEVLGRLRPKADPGPLFPCLQDPDVKLRRAAALAVSRQGGPRAHKALAALLSDPDDRVRELAVRHFTRATDPRSVRPLAVVAAYGDESASRFAAARLMALGYLAVGPLLDALRTTDEPLRAGIAELLAALEGPDAMVIVCKGLEEDDPRIWQTARAVLQRKGAAAVPYLEPLVAHPEPRVRQIAVELLDGVQGASVAGRTGQANPADLPEHANSTRTARYESGHSTLLDLGETT